ncbi:hypothetical protein HWV62_34553 [Athelia sp. TMB]|nr:hypothetical protein HWV62_34553 [Athelia sp. TMB]
MVQLGAETGRQRTTNNLKSRKLDSEPLVTFIFKYQPGYKGAAGPKKIAPPPKGKDEGGARSGGGGKNGGARDGAGGKDRAKDGERDGAGGTGGLSPPPPKGKDENSGGVEGGAKDGADGQGGGGEEDGSDEGDEEETGEEDDDEEEEEEEPAGEAGADDTTGGRPKTPEPITLNFSGYYKYASGAGFSDKEFSTFTLNLNHDDGSVFGSGSDSVGSFNMSGALIDDDLRFIKQYTTGDNTWKYIGKRIPPKGNVYQFVGTWGYPQQSEAYGEFVFASVDQSSSVRPHEAIEGQWTGEYVSSGSGSPMNITISLDPAVQSPPNGPFSIIGQGSDDAGPFDIRGTVGKVNADESGGQADFVKSYASWEWKYTGRYDGNGSIRGTWSDGKGGRTTGSFHLEHSSQLTVALASPMVASVARNLSCSSTLSSVVEIASKKNTGVTPAYVLTLVDSFTS